jgi:hypothetical protein
MPYIEYVVVPLGPKLSLRIGERYTIEPRFIRLSLRRLEFCIVLHSFEQLPVEGNEPLVAADAIEVR